MDRGRRDFLARLALPSFVPVIGSYSATKLDRTLYDPRINSLLEDEQDEKDKGNAKDWPDNGVVSFVYHDGPINDYTEAYPAHEAFDTVATTCPVSEWIGRYYGVADRLSEEHLTEMANSGWEIASHTADHAVLGSFPIRRDIDPDDRRIYPAHHRHGHHTGHLAEITDGDATVNRKIAGFGDDAEGVRYVELEDPVGIEFERDETVIRWPAKRMKETLARSKQALEQMGFDVRSLLAPYDVFDDYSRRFVPDYYDFVANAGSGSGRLNFPASYDPFETIHRYFIEFTSRKSVKADLDDIANSGAFGVFGAHSFKEEVTQRRIEETLEWVEERGITVMTFGDAAELARSSGK